MRMGGSEVEDNEILKQHIINVIFPLCRNVCCEPENLLLDHLLIETHIPFLIICGAFYGLSSNT